MRIWRFATLGVLGVVLCIATARAQEPEETFGCEDGVLREFNLTDGTKAYSAGDNYGVACWDLASDKLLKERKGHGRTVRAIAISPDGKTVVTASDERRCWFGKCRLLRVKFAMKQNRSACPAYVTHAFL